MVINGTSIYTLFPNKVRFLDYSDHAPDITRAVVNADNDYKVLGGKVKIGIRSMQVRIVFYDTKAQAYKMSSSLLPSLMDGIVSFGDGLQFRVNPRSDGTMQRQGTEDMFLWTLPLDILETYGDADFETSTNGTIVLDNTDATYTTPIKITLTPTANIATFSIYGMIGYTVGSPLTVTSLTNGKKVIIYGREKLVLEETSPGVWINKFLDTNISLFPQIEDGVNTTLTFTPTTNITVRVDFNPVYI